MALTYLQISYPNFALGAIIDPEEANQNNFELVNKINDFVAAINKNEVDIQTLDEVKTTKTYVDEKDSNLAGTGRTIETIRQNALNLISHKSSTDHDGRYFTETEINQKINVLNQKDTDIITTINTHKSSNDHDSRYYTREELASWAKGGDTIIKREVFTIISDDNLNNTFTYIDGTGTERIGMIGEDGEQVFTLFKGFYEPGLERLEIIINDTLHRTETSGGLIEISPTEFALTSPEQNGAEITVKYYERIGVGGIANIEYGSDTPAKEAMWFKVVK